MHRRQGSEECITLWNPDIRLSNPLISNSLEAVQVCFCGHMEKINWTEINEVVLRRADVEKSLIKTSDPKRTEKIACHDTTARRNVYRCH